MKTDNSHQATILVVDDNPTNLTVLSDFLNEHGFIILLKKDGEKALELLERKQVDLILLDIVMPGMDGFETCRHLKDDSRWKDIPVIFMSALSETVDKVRGFQLGAVDYITKPFQQEEVLARVQAHLTIQCLKKDLENKNKTLEQAVKRERKLVEDLRLNLSLSLPHELRTPLNSILGFSGLLIEDRCKSDPEKIAQYAKFIHESANRLNRLIENSLLYANLRLLNYALGDRNIHYSSFAVETKTLIPSVAQKVAQNVHREADLQFDLIDATIRMSPKNFEKILVEIVGNAFKFSEPGTPVRIKTSLTGNLCLINISDEGRGMTKSQIESIGAYMQFDRSKHEQQGFGLGLVIATLITQLESGILSIDSKMNQGTTVSLVFPCKSNDTDSLIHDSGKWFQPEGLSGIQLGMTGLRQIRGYESIPSDYSDTEATQKQYKLLIISYEKENREIMNHLLSPIGFHIFQASGYHDGLDRAQECIPDMIWIDRMTLEMDGFDLLHHIRRVPDLYYVKIVIVSDRMDKESLQKHFGCVCNTLIFKPIVASDIFDTLATHLNLKWRSSDATESDSNAAPPEKEIKKLYDLSLQGNIKEIVCQLELLEQINEQYWQFIQHIRNLVNTFQIESIRKFLRKYLKNEPQTAE